MFKRWLLAAGFALAPTAAPAFDTVDSLPWPTTGVFSAYSAEPAGPFQLWLFGGALRDSNVLRTTDNHQNEVITRIGIGARYTTRVYGRQSVLLEAQAEYQDYDRFSELDHSPYRLRGEWLWELGNDLTGALGYTRLRRLADIGELQRPVKDLIIEDFLYFNGRYRFSPDWRLTFGADYGRGSHEDGTIDTINTFGYRGGIEWVTPLGNAVGVEARFAHGNAPVDETLGLGAFPDNKYDEREIAATLAYRLGTQFRLGGRLGHTTREYTDISGRDFSGTTGRGFIEWLAGNKTTLSFEAYKEPATILDTDALYVVRSGVAFGVAWAPTIKWVYSARFISERRVFEGDPAVELAGAQLRDETLHLVRLGLGWEPLRRWQLATAFDIGERNSNELGRDYDYYAVSLNARYTFQ